MKRTKLRSVSNRGRATKELDALLRKVVLARDGCCRRCGTTERLHVSHILPKGKYPSMRYELSNVLALCVGDHLYFWHRDPLGAAEWMEKHLGREYYGGLVRTADMRRGSRRDTKLMRAYLESELKKLEGASEPHKGNPDRNPGKGPDAPRLAAPSERGEP